MLILEKYSNLTMTCTFKNYEIIMALFKRQQFFNLSKIYCLPYTNAKPD